MMIFAGVVTIEGDHRECRVSAVMSSRERRIPVRGEAGQRVV